MNKFCLNEDYCKGCQICIEVCPKDAIRARTEINAKGYYLPEAGDMALCTGCKLCEIVCPDFAIAIELDLNKEEAVMGDKDHPFSELHHVSVVVKDIDAAQAFYESIGFGPFVDYPPMKEYTKINVPDEEGFYDLTIRCAQMGPVQFQLIQPGEGESLYRTFLEEKGEGVYHLGFVVDDIDGAEATVKEMGVLPVSSGRRENGSGFSYLDTAEKGGVTLLIRQSPPT